MQGVRKEGSEREDGKMRWGEDKRCTEKRKWERERPGGEESGRQWLEKWERVVCGGTVGD